MGDVSVVGCVGSLIVATRGVAGPGEVLLNVRHLSQGVERVVQERAVNDYWTQVDPDLGARVAQAWAWRLCSKAGSSKDNPLAAPEQVPLSIGATSTRTSATACPMTSTRLCRGRL